MNLDPSGDTEVLSLPFEQTREFPIPGSEQLFITTFKPGSLIPMTWKIPGQPDKECNEFCLNVGNGDDLVMKNYIPKELQKSGISPTDSCRFSNPFGYIMDSSKPDEKIAIVVCNADGSPRKYILFFLKESKLVFKRVSIFPSIHCINRLLGWF